MNTTKLNPNQIITLNDYPVHSDTVLREYFRKCQQGKEVPFVPVIRKEIVRKYLDNTLLKKFEEFEDRNPDAKYFMLDGSHRTTALTLAGCKITAIIYETDSDIDEARKLVATGQIRESGTLHDSLEENCEVLSKHFKRKPYFQTVEEKTRKMVREKIVPDILLGLFINMGYFIIIRGPLGCGKSIIAKRLAGILNAEYIPIDRVLDEHNLTKDKEAGYISQRSFIKANEIITPKAKKKLQSGISVIFDGNFYWKSQIDDLISKLSFPHFVFTLKAPLKVCIERDRLRGETHGEDAARAVYKKTTEFDYGIVIDITKPIEEAIKDILSCLPKSLRTEVLLKNDMRKIVEEGYEKGDYTHYFRKDKTPNKMEKHFLDALIKRIPKKATVLDLGCGTGIPIDKYLVEKKIQVTGIDISQKHISIAKHNVPLGKFIKADFSRFNFGKEKFNAIVSFYAIFHIPRGEHKALFLKMRTLLKEGGIILITLGTSGSEYGEEENWAGAKMAWSTYSPKVYTKMIKECGFSIIKSEFEGKPRDEEYHFWLLAQKTHQMTKKTL